MQFRQMDCRVTLTKLYNDPKQSSDPASIRKIFGDNLRELCAPYPSITAVCRELGINRSQFNRYLAGDSFPRPDVLHKICNFFDVDGRILLQTLEQTANLPSDLLNHPVLRNFFGDGPTALSERLFPSGFYRFVRRSFIYDDQLTVGLVFVWREDGYTFMRGYEPRAAMRAQGLKTSAINREYRGLIMRQQEGVMALVTHRHAAACSFNFLSPETSIQSDIWEGYATRTVREKITARRATRMVYEFIGHDLPLALKTARKAGLVSIDDIPPFHARLLRMKEEFR